MPIPKMIQDSNNEQMQMGKMGVQLAPLVVGAAAVDVGVIDADADSAVRLISTKDIHFDIRVGAVAAVTDTILPAGVIEYWVVPKGGTVSAIEVAAGAGDLRVTVLA